MAHMYSAATIQKQDLVLLRSSQIISTAITQEQGNTVLASYLSKGLKQEYASTCIRTLYNILPKLYTCKYAHYM